MSIRAVVVDLGGVLLEIVDWRKWEQRLKNHESLEEIFKAGIAFVVERFIAVGQAPLRWFHRDKSLHYESYS